MNPERQPGAEPGAARDELGGGFSRRAVRWLTGIAGASLLAALLLTAYGQELGRPPDPRPTAWSVSAIGHAAFAELLRARGLGVEIKQTHSLRFAAGGARRALLLLAPEPGGLAPLGGARESLGEQVRAASASQVPLVLVLPKWGGAPRPERPNWIGPLRLLAPARVMDAVTALGRPELAGLELRRGAGGGLDCRGWEGGPRAAVELPEAQLLADPAEKLVPLVACRGGLLAGALRLGEGGPWLLLVSDPDLLDNQGLGRGANADVAVALLATWLGVGGVVFDETIHGYRRSPGLLAEALAFPLVLATAQLALAGALLVWAACRRFGKPLPEAAGLPPGKQALIDNTAQLLTAGGHAGDSLARYHRQTTRAVAAHFFLPADLLEPELLARLQQISDQRGLGIDLAGLAGVGGSAGAPGERGGLAAAQRLHRWRQSMLEER